VRVVGDREFESNGEEEVGGRKKPRGKESPNPGRDGRQGKGKGGAAEEWGGSAQRSAARKQPALANLLSLGIPSSLARVPVE
jgi:hypothetical protein